MRAVAKKLFLQRPLFFICLIILPFFGIYATLLYQTPQVPFYEEEKVALTGVVNDKFLSEDGFVSALHIKGTRLFKVYPKSGFLLPENIPMGSVVRVRGKVRHFRVAGNPGEFDVAAYYENRGILFYINAESIEIVDNPVNMVRENFFEIKIHFCSLVKKYCPIEYGTINTLLFGDKSELDESRKNLYKSAGLSHFLVISGLHISVAGGGIYMLFRRFGLKREPAALFGISFILFYGCVVGFSVSVKRAVIMYFLRLCADILKRSYDMLTAWAVAATVTLFGNPLWIRDAAFLYSYTAVLFVGLYLTFIRRKQEGQEFAGLYEKKGIKYFLAQLRLTASVPILIYLALLPISLYFQSYSNLLSIPLNLILGLLTSPILLFAALGFFFSLVKFSFFAALFDFLCALLLRIIDIMSTAFSGISFTKLIFKPSLTAVFIYYFVFVLTVFILYDRMPVIIKTLTMMICITAISTNLSPNKYITVLDVSQGDCIVIRTGPRSAIIVDCGSTGRKDISENVVIPFLMSQGLTEINDIYISHSDLDHIGGIKYLLENNISDNIKIKRIIFPALPRECFDEKLSELMQIADQKKIPCSTISAGGSVSYGNVTVKALNPHKNNITGDSNEDSLVLWVNIASFDALLTGDATENTENNLRLPENVSFEMLKVAHHGSRFSSTDNFLRRLSPDVAIISVGASNNYGHPHPDTLTRLRKNGAKIYRTDIQGAVTVYTNGFHFSVKNTR